MTASCPPDVAVMHEDEIVMASEPSQKEKKEEKPDITLFHPDLLEVPKDGRLPYLKRYKCKKCGQIDSKNTLCGKCWGEEFGVVPRSPAGANRQRAGAMASSTGPLTASGIRANQACRNVPCTRTPPISTTPPP